jgi:hypothetical protein
MGLHSGDFAESGDGGGVVEAGGLRVPGWLGGPIGFYPRSQRRDRGHPAPGFISGCGLSAEEVFDFLEQDVAADVGDGIRERNALGADFYAVLGEAAFLNAAVAGEGAQALFLADFAGWMVIE